MTRAFSRFRRLRDDRGTVAVEFGLIAPLLITLLFGAVEFTRLWMAHRQFEATVTGIARHLARYPEYDVRVRAYAPPIARALMPFGSTAGLNMVVYSLKKQAAGMALVFPAHTLFGGDPGIPWTNAVKSANYVLDEAVIDVAASYRYTPLVAFGSRLGYTFKKSYIILPSFNRSYPWNEGAVADKYVY